MTVSNLSTGLRPGVCLSTSRPTVPYVGQTIFETDTNKLLAWNGTVWVIPNSPAQNPQGLEFIRHDVIAAGTSTYSFNNCFNSTYENYKVIITNCTPNTGSAELRFVWRVNGADKTASVYQSQWVGLDGGGNSQNGVSTNTAYGYFGINPNFNGGHVNPATLEIYSPNVNVRDMLTFNSATYRGAFVTRSGSIAYDGLISGSYVSDGFSLYTSSGTFSATVSIYGYRKS